VEQSMESVNAYRLQVNDSLYRLQQNVESIQSASAPLSNRLGGVFG